jgi:hypothetical protein
MFFEEIINSIPTYMLLEGDKSIILYVTLRNFNLQFSIFRIDPITSLDQFNKEGNCKLQRDF